MMSRLCSPVGKRRGRRGEEILGVSTAGEMEVDVEIEVASSRGRFGRVVVTGSR